MEDTEITNEGGIPINLGDLPVEVIDMEESGVYSVKLKACDLADNLSKKGVLFCKPQFEVISGDYEGYTVFLNYLPVPVPVPDEPKSDKIKAINNNAQFAKMCAVFGIKGNMPPVRATDLASRRNWQEWMNQFTGDNGVTGKITITNQEFPEGSGRKRPNVRDFVYS